MSLEEYEALPEGKPYLEYWDGVVLQKPVPREDHWMLQGILTMRIVTYALQVGGFAGPEAHIWFESHGYRVPDVCFWAPGKNKGTKERSLPPTLVIEVGSPDQSLNALRDKSRGMRDNGVDVCWLIHPQARRAEVFDNDVDGASLSGDAALSSNHLPGFELSLPELFSILDR
jgi:Uma2 family endonuclease